MVRQLAAPPVMVRRPCHVVAHGVSALTRHPPWRGRSWYKAAANEELKVIVSF